PTLSYYSNRSSSKGLISYPLLNIITVVMYSAKNS
ncbi:MAG: hypothetical protein ACI8YB_001966, partial [Patiriisocius sp.]